MNKDNLHLLLVRHGNTFEDGQPATYVGLKTDMPLTAKGRGQAQRMGEFLKSKNIVPAAVYAGSLCRQTEAARIIAESLGAEVRLVLSEKALNEVDYGPWEGLTGEQITERWPKEFADWTEASIWPEGIIEGSMKARTALIRDWLETLRSNYQPGDTIAALTSNGNIRFFYSFIQAKWDELVRTRRMKELKVGTGCYCELELGPDELNVISWNQKP